MTVAAAILEDDVLSPASAHLSRLPARNAKPAFLFPVNDPNEDSARSLLTCIALIAIVVGSASAANARNLRNTLAKPGAPANSSISAALRPLGAAAAVQVANEIPTLSTSAGFTYEYNSELEIYQRSTRTFGPLFAERATTIGRNRFNVGIAYSYLDFSRFNGHDLDNLTSRLERADLNGTPVFTGLVRPDLASSLPGVSPSGTFDRVRAKVDLEAQIVDFNVTYGATDDLDVNVLVPVVRTFARLSLSETTLDPRYLVAHPEFQDLEPIEESTRSREGAVGVGDIRLRGKYQPRFTGPVRVAGLLDLVLPTGSPGNFHGAGYTRLGSYVIASGVVRDIFEPHAQLGVEWNCEDASKSQAKYLTGVTTQITHGAALSFDFVGRSEFEALSTIPSTARLPEIRDGAFVQPLRLTGAPVFLDVKRNDVLDIAIGGKIAVGDRAIVFANATFPLNDDGLRANIVPTLGFEASF